MKYQVTPAEKTTEVVKEIFWLAWNACGGPVGMGFFQNHPSANKEDVWKNVNTSGDYVFNVHGSNSGDYYGDYVFGRMMKLSVKVSGNIIDIPSGNPRPDYQGWSRIYKSYEELVKTAAKNLNVQIV